MYEEGNRSLSFNWGQLLIKLIILALIVFLAGWIFIKVTNNVSTNSQKLAMEKNEYITDITSMKNAAFEYYTSSKLPEKVGGTDKLTLTQMLNQKLLIDFTDDGKTCDTNSSYIQTTKTADGNYALKVSLTCGEKSDFIITTIESNENGTITNSDVIVDDEPVATEPTPAPAETKPAQTAPATTTKPSTSNNTTNNYYTTTTPAPTTTSSSSTTTTTTTVKTTVSIKFSCTSACCTNNCNNGGNVIINNNNNNNNNNGDGNNNGNNNQGVVKPENPTPDDKVSSYTLTIKYLYSDGTTAKNAYIATLAAGATYNVNSPVISGYIADKTVVSGTMPSNDVTVTVIYSKEMSIQPIPTTTRYYKFVQWSDWSDGKSNAEGAENKSVTESINNFCKNEQKTIYSTGYITDNTYNGRAYDYELQMLELSASSLSNVSISNQSYFTSGTTDYQAYINARGGVHMTNNNGAANVYMTNATSFMNSSLKSSNFGFSVSYPYVSGGVYRTRININIYNKNGVTPYYANNLGYNVYFVPLKFNVSYTNLNQCTTSKNSYMSGYTLTGTKTETVWYHRIPTYKWSTSKTLPGYEYTGEYEDR